jgi:hypothetical protein
MSATDFLNGIMLNEVRTIQQWALVNAELDMYKGKLTSVVYTQGAILVERVAPEDVLLFPPVCEIHSTLRKITGDYGIMYDTASNKHRVVGLRFGVPTRLSVPMFEDGKVVRNRMVSTTRHATITGKSFESCSRKLFCYAVQGRLFAHAGKGRFDKLIWDTEFNEFSTQTVSADSII